MQCWPPCPLRKITLFIRFDTVQKLRARSDTLSARDQKALTEMEDMLEQALASGKITRH